MPALFVAAISCVVIMLTEAQMDRRGHHQGDEGVRTRAQRIREEEEERRREEEEQRRRETEQRRRREQEERQRREEEGRRAIELIQRRLREQRVDAVHLEILEDVIERLPQDARSATQDQINLLRERIREAELSKPEE